MRIAIMSDSHDHIQHLESALHMIKKAQVDQIIHCGDFVAPFMLKLLNSADIPAHAVLGNNDGDVFQLTKLAFTELKHVHLHGEAGRIDACGKSIGFVHDPLKLGGLLHDGRVAVACYGHTHTHNTYWNNDTLVINPGEIMGKDGSPGFCILNMPDMTCTYCPLV